MPKVLNKLEKITLDTSFESFMRKVRQYRKKSMSEYKKGKYDADKIYSKMLTAYIEDFNKVLTDEVLPKLKDLFEVGDEESVAKDIMVSILISLEEARRNNVLDEGNFLLLQVLVFDFEDYFYPVYLGDFKSFSNLVETIEDFVLTNLPDYEDRYVSNRGFSKYGTFNGRNFGNLKN
jgi:hypothetical protein